MKGHSIFALAVSILGLAGISVVSYLYGDQAARDLLAFFTFIGVWYVAAELGEMSAALRKGGR